VPIDNDPPTPSRARRTLIVLGIAAVVILFVVLHLTGVMGPGSN
jgi:hypothetical protein